MKDLTLFSLILFLTYNIASSADIRISEIVKACEGNFTITGSVISSMEDRSRIACCIECVVSAVCAAAEWTEGENYCALYEEFLCQPQISETGRDVWMKVN